MGAARPGGAGREDAHDALDPSIAICGYFSTKIGGFGGHGAL
jgi:hypothetical protein